MMIFQLPIQAVSLCGASRFGVTLGSGQAGQSADLRSGLVGNHRLAVHGAGASVRLCIDLFRPTNPALIEPGAHRFRSSARCSLALSVVLVRAARHERR